MKALSLWQPWATAIAVGSKGIETRGWPTAYRGPLAIHAAKRKVMSDLRPLLRDYQWVGALNKAGWDEWPCREKHIDRLPFGAIVAVADLTDCRPTEAFNDFDLGRPGLPGPIGGHPATLFAWSEEQMGDFAPGRFGWVLSNVRPLARPVPWKGAQGLFTVSDDVVASALEAAE